MGLEQPGSRLWGPFKSMYVVPQEELLSILWKVADIFGPDEIAFPGSYERMQIRFENVVGSNCT